MILRSVNVSRTRDVLRPAPHWKRQVIWSTQDTLALRTVNAHKQLRN